MAYKHLFFDLDHTLWDFERNSGETLAELHSEFRLADFGVLSVAELQSRFCQITTELWREYDNNRLTKEELRANRFSRIFSEMGLENPPFCDALNDAYAQRCPLKGHLMEGTLETLDYLAPRYSLHVITNGFDEIQPLKMKHAGLTEYFQSVTTSQSAGAKKPDPRIFTHAMSQAGCTASEGMMIGDNCDTDIAGGKAAGLDTVFYNPLGDPSSVKPTHTIQDLRELKAIL